MWFLRSAPLLLVSTPRASLWTVRSSRHADIKENKSDKIGIHNQTELHAEGESVEEEMRTNCVSTSSQSGRTRPPQAGRVQSTRLLPEKRTIDYRHPQTAKTRKRRTNEASICKEHRRRTNCEASTIDKQTEKGKNVGQIWHSTRTRNGGDLGIGTKE